ncbi:MAG: hypothetical protein CR982_05355 [Candidatus Cloacimonadota bacterium]|nr:MAG: hypothetical protein CR982_05355 [Candidatus Cloacimonadota bacterium]PIE77994.1 MAG: hypothetical protein CSA15_10055 [Candidatus Delongbacteria bacterium]
MRIALFFLFILLVSCATERDLKNEELLLLKKKGLSLDNFSLLPKSSNEEFYILVDEKGTDEANPCMLNDSTIIYQRRTGDSKWSIYSYSFKSMKSTPFYEENFDLFDPKIEFGGRYLICSTYEDSLKENRDIIIYDTKLKSEVRVGVRGADDYNVTIGDNCFYYISNRNDEIKSVYDKDEDLSLIRYNLYSGSETPISMEKPVFFYRKYNGKNYFVDNNFNLNSGEYGDFIEHDYSYPVGSFFVENGKLYCRAFKDENSVIGFGGKNNLNIIIDEEECGTPYVKKGKIFFHAKVEDDLGIFVK